MLPCLSLGVSPLFLPASLLRASRFCGCFGVFAVSRPAAACSARTLPRLGARRHSHALARTSSFIRCRRSQYKDFEVKRVLEVLSHLSPRNCHAQLVAKRFAGEQQRVGGRVGAGINSRIARLLGSFCVSSLRCSCCFVCTRVQTAASRASAGTARSSTRIRSTQRCCLPPGASCLAEFFRVCLPGSLAGLQARAARRIVHSPHRGACLFTSEPLPPCLLRLRCALHHHRSGWRSGPRRAPTASWRCRRPTSTLLPTSRSSTLPSKRCDTHTFGVGPVALFALNLWVWSLSLVAVFRPRRVS